MRPLSIPSAPEASTRETGVLGILMSAQAPVDGVWTHGGAGRCTLFATRCQSHQGLESKCETKGWPQRARSEKPTVPLPCLSSPSAPGKPGPASQPACAHAHTHTHVRTHACTCVHAHVYTCVCIHTCAHTHTRCSHCTFTDLS